MIRLEKFEPEAKQLVAGAQQLADARQHGEVIPLHLLARAVERSPAVGAVLKSAGAEPKAVVELCERALGKLARGASVAYVSPRFADLLDRAEREATRDHVDKVGLGQILHALAQEIRGPVGEIFAHFGIGPGGFRDHVGALEQAPKLGTSPSPVASGAAVEAEFLRDLVADARADRFDPVIGRDAELRRVLQILERRTKNHPLVVGEPGVGKTTLVRALARRIAQGDVPTRLAGARMFELDTGALVAGAKLRGEIEQRLKAVTDRLAKSEGAESILVVEDLHTLFGTGVTGSGVGELLKPHLSRGELRIVATTTADGVQKINERDPAILRRFASFVLEPPSVDYAQSILRGIAARYERHHHVGISEGAIRTAVVLAKRYLGDRALPDAAVDLLDETASKKRVEVDGVPAEVDATMRRLESLETQLAGLAEDDTKLGVETRNKLEAEAAELRPKVVELRHRLEARRGVVVAVVGLKKELAAAHEARDRARDEKSFAMLGELEHVTIPDLTKRLAAAEKAAQDAGAGAVAATLVTEADVAATVNEWTGIPVAKMLEGEADKLLHMEKRLAQRVVGQDEAVGAVARAVRRGRVGLRDPGKPIGSFLFLGPSGVGKTHLAKALAEFLFDDENAMTRLDMSEFMEKHMAQRLVGSPPGYADSEQGGQLTEAVRRRPYSVLLFDEVEKAHGDVFNMLLQVLDDGRLTDGRGRTSDFSNTVVIMTSNIGSARILETEPKMFESAEGRDALRDVLKDEVGKFFRPEFLNRIDDIVVFKALDRANLRGIVDIELGKLGRMLRERDIQLEASDAAKVKLVELGYEPALGARPLKRAILRELQNPLAQAILEGGALASGKIAVDVDGDKLVFKPAAT